MTSLATDMQSKDLISCGKEELCSATAMSGREKQRIGNERKCHGAEKLCNVLEKL